MNRRFLPLLCLLSLLAIAPAWAAPKTATLDDLKRLPIICLVPKWLPEGYQLRSVKIDREDREGIKDPKAPGFATYEIEYSNGKKGSFTIESARWGIGDRNLDDSPSAEEGKFSTKSFGEIYTVYDPKGKAGVKKRIAANWIEDANWRAEDAKKKDANHILGRAHGVSGFGMTLEEFEKIVQSLHSIKEG